MIVSDVLQLAGEMQSSSEALHPKGLCAECDALSYGSAILGGVRPNQPLDIGLLGFSVTIVALAKTLLGDDVVEDLILKLHSVDAVDAKFNLDSSTCDARFILEDAHECSLDIGLIINSIKCLLRQRSSLIELCHNPPMRTNFREWLQGKVNQLITCNCDIETCTEILCARMPHMLPSTTLRTLHLSLLRSVGHDAIGNCRKIIWQFVRNPDLLLIKQNCSVSIVSLQTGNVVSTVIIEYIHAQVFTALIWGPTVAVTSRVSSWPEDWTWSPGPYVENILQGKTFVVHGPNSAEHFCMRLIAVSVDKGWAACMVGEDVWLARPAENGCVEHWSRCLTNEFHFSCGCVIIAHGDLLMCIGFMGDAHSQVSVHKVSLANDSVATEWLCSTHFEKRDAFSGQVFAVQGNTMAFVVERGLMWLPLYQETGFDFNGCRQIGGCFDAVALTADFVISKTIQHVVEIRALQGSMRVLLRIDGMGKLDGTYSWPASRKSDIRILLENQFNSGSKASGDMKSTISASSRDVVSHPAEAQNGTAGRQADTVAASRQEDAAVVRKEDAAVGRTEDAELEHALEQSNEDAVTQECAHIAEALLCSRQDTPADDAVVLRLSTRTAEIITALLESPALEPALQRVQQAGCEVSPPWANGALLLMPLTFEMVTEVGLQLRAHHIISLRCDVGLIKNALAIIPRRRRAKLWEEDLHRNGSTATSLAAASSSWGGGDQGTAEAEEELGESFDVELVEESTFLTIRRVSASPSVVTSAPAGTYANRQQRNPRLPSPVV